MVREDAIVKLQVFEPRLRALGATALFLFGSTARGEAAAASDLDLFLEYDPASRFDLLDLIKAKHMVEDELGVSVDMTTRGGLHPLIKATIEDEAIQVF
ncbi:nucleotidyltransferase family protein [Beijerinckia sp. L45]|uniref:nucleotidyltransferase family protein n=1 Tax=Beijerinckia sp. L45 TaxID=1641855 RepID=UPI00131BC248|nr:nucleotidyltransferase domain-containing protein [Beijerinckia sp. L45]